jgi:hypothetical protein
MTDGGRNPSRAKRVGLNCVRKRVKKMGQENEENAKKTGQPDPFSATRFPRVVDGYKLALCWRAGVQTLPMKRGRR